MSRFLPFVATPLLIASIAQAQSTDSTAGKSVWQGVYTEEQATRGDTEHQNNCNSCHGTEKYSGENFTKNWVGRTVFDLFDQIKTTMPDDNPGGLSAQQYKDVVAYILKTNGFPAGTDSLPSDPEAMLTSFLQSTYEAAAALAKWDRARLEREPVAPSLGRRRCGSSRSTRSRTSRRHFGRCTTRTLTSRQPRRDSRPLFRSV